LRARRQWHAEQLKQALVGAHGKVLEQLQIILEKLTPQSSPTALVRVIEAQDWKVDDDNFLATQSAPVHLCGTTGRPQQSQQQGNLKSETRNAA